MEKLATKLASKTWKENTFKGASEYKFKFENNLKGSITEEPPFMGSDKKTKPFSIQVNGDKIVFETSLWVHGAKYILKELPNGFEFRDEQNEVFKSII